MSKKNNKKKKKSNSIKRAEAPTTPCSIMIDDLMFSRAMYRYFENNSLNKVKGYLIKDSSKSGYTLIDVMLNDAIYCRSDVPIPKDNPGSLNLLQIVSRDLVKGEQLYKFSKICFEKTDSWTTGKLDKSRKKIMSVSRPFVDKENEDEEFYSNFRNTNVRDSSLNLRNSRNTEEDLKCVVKFRGSIIDLKYDCNGMVKAILISIPKFYDLDSNTKDAVIPDTHMWLYLSDMVLPRIGSVGSRVLNYNRKDVDGEITIDLCETVNFVGIVVKYKTDGSFKYGIRDWMPLYSGYFYGIEDKFNKDQSKIVIRNTALVNDVKNELPHTIVFRRDENGNPKVHKYLSKDQLERYKDILYNVFMTTSRFPFPDFCFCSVMKRIGIYDRATAYPIYNRDLLCDEEYEETIISTANKISLSEEEPNMSFVLGALAQNQITVMTLDKNRNSPDLYDKKAISSYVYNDRNLIEDLIKEYQL